MIVAALLEVNVDHGRSTERSHGLSHAALLDDLQTMAHGASGLSPPNQVTSLRTILHRHQSHDELGELHARELALQMRLVFH